MATEENNQTGPSTPPVRSGLEMLARVGALAAATVYAAGFLIVAIHHSQFGISQFSPLKPRIFSAGVLFLLLTGIPAVAAARFHGLFTGADDRSSVQTSALEKWLRRLSVGIVFYPPCFILAKLSEPLFSPHPHLNLWELWGLGLFILYVPFFFFVGDVAWKRFSQYPGRCTVLLFLVTFLFFLVVLQFWNRTFFWLTVWFYVIGTGAILFYHKALDPKQRREEEWEKLALVLLVVLFYFATGIYAAIKPSYGGGLPTPVILHLSDGTPVSSSETARVLLVDETDHGYYVVQPGGRRTAFFLRRDLVRAVEFYEAPRPSRPREPTKPSRKP